ncbi:MAG: TetR/AcrR family transcriptional regulator, partial [Acidimicrobiaceae bacterium]|nr:TetR/AcrR family transcriptional regulator [Acidimicrobiaceae bacterium]
MAVGENAAQPPHRSPGRPRLHEPREERDLILAAALEVLRRNEGEEATVADILQQAGLSTRAFYRHFETKEDIIRALYERDAESFGSHLRRSVEAAGEPRAALAAWVNEVLGLAYDRRRAERMTALGSPMVQRVVGGTRAQRLGNELMAKP